MLHRIIEKNLTHEIANSSKIIIIYGPRQVGKTTLVRKILKELPIKSIEINADQLKYQEITKIP